MPKRARIGAVSMPSRVVAPTSVNCSIGIVTVLRLRSVAEPDVDLVVLHRRIEELLDDRPQSMDLVDEQDVAARRLVSVDTRSPGFSSAGPELVWMFTPSSRAISSASVVLPSPGGPKKSVWSSGSRRWSAASM